jgi:uncharacterized integral membrane protein
MQRERSAQPAKELPSIMRTVVLVGEILVLMLLAIFIAFEGDALSLELNMAYWAMVFFMIAIPYLDLVVVCRSTAADKGDAGRSLKRFAGIILVVAALQWVIANMVAFTHRIN